MSEPVDRADREPVIGLRRVPGPDGEGPPPGDPALEVQVRDEIRASGPMTFARFMALALYDPEHGYYTRPDASGASGPGRGGDFLTAPEGHPIFGWALARQVEEVWDRLGRPAGFTIREHGAGRGALATALLEGLGRAGSPLLETIHYEAVDASADRLDALQQRLAEAGFGDRLAIPGPEPITGVILANELLDALPVHVVLGGPDGDLLERFVDLDEDGAFHWTSGQPSDPLLAERLATAGVALEPGQAGEIRLADEPWCAAVAASLARGLVIVIDYGHPAARLYAPATGSTLRTYSRHRVHADPFVAVGRQDLTAHVDLDAVTRAMTSAGLDHLGTTTQAELLVSLGIGDLLAASAARPMSELEDHLAARAAVVRAIDPAATGRFAVLLFGRGIAAEPALLGLTFRRGPGRS